MPQVRHILHIIDSLDYAGAQMLLVALAERIPKDRYRMSVCVLQPDSLLTQRLEASGVTVFCLQRPRPSVLEPGKFFSYFINNIKDVINICRQAKVQVIQCHLADAEIVGTIAGKLCRAETIITTNHFSFLPSGRWLLDPRNLFRRLLYWWISNKGADSVVAVSEDIADKLIEYYHVKPENIRIVKNGINVDLFGKKQATKELKRSLGVDSTGKILTTIGRLTVQKGQTYLIDAMHSLVSKGYHLKLFIVGEGELKEQLIAQTAALGMDEHIQFLGRRSDIADILSITDIFVFPSLWEGTSLALLEAMASGNTIIASAEPGNKAVLQHGVSGYLIPPGDVAALVEAVGFMIDNPDIANSYGHNAFLTAKEIYDVGRTIREYEPLWTEAKNEPSTE